MHVVHAVFTVTLNPLKTRWQQQAGRPRCVLLQEDAQSFLTDIYLVRSSVYVNVSSRCATSTELTTFSTSTGPQLCMSGSCVCCQRCTETHPSSILCPHTPQCFKPYSDMKGDYYEPTPQISYFWSSFVPFFSLFREKMAPKFRIWRNSLHLHTEQTDQ